MNPSVGKADRYLRKAFHARGGMGEVWLSQDQVIGREVALKILRGSGGNVMARFIAEAQVTGQLEHPAIVPVHDMGIDADGKPFYVMKFIRGRTLRHAIADFHAAAPTSVEARNPRAPDAPPSDSKPVQQVRLLQIFIDICQAIAYAHSRGVLHRDLKPDNVMLGSYGETLVVDWGLAKVRGSPETIGGLSSVKLSASSGSGETGNGSVIGTPTYMPPEMAEGRIADTDERTDVYLLGATLYEILTGVPPRQGASHLEILELARTARPLPPRKIRGDCPRPLESIAQKAMAQRPEDRYASASELATDVRCFLAGAPVSAHPESWPSRGLRWCRRHRRGLVRGAIFAVISSLIIAAGYLIHAAEERRLAVESRLNQLKEESGAMESIRVFRASAEQARFYAAGTDPLAERAPYFDLARGEAAARAAIAVAAPWGDRLERLPAPNQRETLRQELGSLMLILARLQTRESAPVGADVESLKLLDRARDLIGPSRTDHRLRAAWFHFTGKEAEASAAERSSVDPALPSSALDEFLEGERLRTLAAHTDPTAPLPTLEQLAHSPVAISAGADPEARASADHRARLAQSLEPAIEAYRRAIQLDSHHYWAHFQIGRCYLSLGRVPEAIEALGTCVALQPQSPWGYSARGLACALQGRWQEADADLAHAIRLRPDFRPARLNRGLVYWMRGNQDAAASDFTAVLAPPDSERLREATYYLGQLFLQRHELDKAIVELDRAVAAMPRFRPVWLARAQAQFMRGESAAGLADLDAYLAGGPVARRLPESFARRGHLLRLLAMRAAPPGQSALLRLARRDLESAVQSDSLSPGVFDDLGAVCQSLSDSPAALEAYSSGLTLAPRDVRMRVKRGWLLCEEPMRDYARAEADFATAASVQNDNAEAYSGLGYVRACRKTGNAEQITPLALIHGAGDYLILHNVACTYAEMSKSDPSRAAEYDVLAIGLLRQAIELWRRGGTGPDELELIRQEPAFPPALRARPEFRALMPK